MTVSCKKWRIKSNTVFFEYDQKSGIDKMTSALF